ncbi:XK-related protein 8 isoform X2 [Patella vulgata]|uniref:XK-related protein 8 isoform X2 n=1 Tax=Patella vulgata TaxID=6465 RepID=UPI00217FECC9|nr:XK-related protein 8 isoform X2 [Patella vulgata]
MSIKTKVPISRRCNKNWHEFFHFPNTINTEGVSRDGIFKNRQKADDAFSDIESEPFSFELQSVKNDDVDLNLSSSDRTETTPTCRSTRKYNRPISATDKVDVAFGKGEEKLQSVSDYYDTFEYDFNYFFLFLGIVSVIVFILDIVSDVYLAFKYFEDGHLIFGLTTTFLTAGPSFVMCCLGIHWYILDYRSEKIIIQEHQKARNCCEPAHQTTTCLWILRFLCTILQIGPLIRTVEYLYYGCMSMNKKLSREEKIRYHRWMLYEDLDACLLRLFESFLESAPQLIFQLYAWATLKPSEDVVSSALVNYMTNQSTRSMRCNMGMVKLTGNGCIILL